MTPEDVLARFVGVPWFENSGKHLDSRSPVKAWAEAADSCSDDHWTLITEASAASMTGDLSVMCPKRFGTWNETVAWVKLNILEEHVEPQIRKRELAGEFSAAVADCVRWDVLHAAMELLYTDCRAPGFFCELLAVYEQGYFPCGWSGDWPAGEVIRY